MQSGATNFKVLKKLVLTDNRATFLFYVFVIIAISKEGIRCDIPIWISEMCDQTHRLIELSQSNRRAIHSCVIHVANSVSLIHLTCIEPKVVIHFPTKIILFSIPLPLLHVGVWRVGVCI